MNCFLYIQLEFGRHLLLLILYKSESQVQMAKISLFFIQLTHN